MKYTTEELVMFLESFKGLIEWDCPIDYQIVLDEAIFALRGGRSKRNIDAVTYLNIINKMHQGKTTREFFDMFEGLENPIDRVDFVVKWAEENITDLKYDWRLP